MTDQDIRIERVKLADLPTLAARLIDRAAPGDYIPITRHRAEALAHNPFAEPDDVAMLVAWRGDNCVGYFGIMPVKIYYRGQTHKVHWFTTWSVHPSMLGQGLGSRLMEEALKLKQDFAIVGSKPARRVCARFGFEELNSFRYAHIDLRIAGCLNPLTLLLRALRKAFSLIGLKVGIESLSKPFKRLFELGFGWLLRPLALALLRSQAPRTLQGLHTHQVEQLSDLKGEVDDRPRFYRDVEIVNWMLAHPWVLPPGQSPSEQLDYAFTDTRPDFELLAFELTRSTGDTPEGYVAFQFSKIAGVSTLKVLDYLLPTDRRGLLLALAARIAAEKGAQIIEGPMDLVAPLENGLAHRLLVEERKRIYQVMPSAADSPLGRAWQHLQLSYIDGDTPFT